MNAAPTLVSQPPTEAAATLTAVEAAERAQLKDQLRVRHSLDHIAKGWYGGLGAMLLTGTFVRGRLGYMSPAVTAGFGVVAALAWVFCAYQVVRAVRLMRIEGAKLRRLEELNVRAPKIPELF